jgi:putative ABC transport system substrate-binding protein
VPIHTGEISDPAIAAGIGQFAAIQSVASSSAVELSVIDPRDAVELERALDTFAREPNGGAIVTAAASTTARGLEMPPSVLATADEVIE